MNNKEDIEINLNDYDLLKIENSIREAEIKPIESFKTSEIYKCKNVAFYNTKNFARVAINGKTQYFIRKDSIYNTDRVLQKNGILFL